MIKQRGFTLIEVMIAISIVAVIGLASAQVIDTVLRSDRISVDADKRITLLQRTYQMVQRDIMQMTPRFVRIEGAQAQKKVMFSGENVLESELDGIVFTRNGWRNPAQMFPRGTIQGVGYRVIDEKLERLHYLYPDQSAGSEPQVTVLIEGVTKFKIEYFSNSQWVKQWSGEKLPEGLAFVMTTQALGDLRWQFIVSNDGGK